MKKEYFILPLLIILLVSCYREPEIPDEPYIEYRSLYYSEADNNGDVIEGPQPVDSLTLKFYFEDGDGDIGFYPEETFFPYNPYFGVIDANDDSVTISSDSEPPFYLVAPGHTQKYLYSEEDTRPPFNCQDYLIEGNDTLFILANEYHFNLHLFFYRKINGVYQEIDIAEEFGNSCGLNYNGRIPVFDSEYEENKNSITGTISYSIQSPGIKQLLKNDTFKIDFYIYDYALNQSNRVSTPDLRLLNLIK